MDWLTFPSVALTRILRLSVTRHSLCKAVKAVDIRTRSIKTLDSYEAYVQCTKIYIMTVMYGHVKSNVFSPERRLCGLKSKHILNFSAVLSKGPTTNFR